MNKRKLGFIGLSVLLGVLSGILAGLGGASMSLAAMIFGNWKPQGAMWACLLFGAAQGFIIYLGGTSVEISSQILAMVPYILTLIVLILFVGRSRGPSANGDSYIKN